MNIGRLCDDDRDWIIFAVTPLLKYARPLFSKY